DSATVAHCVALMCHLLGPERAQALSFATYCGRPDTASVHGVGVPPGFDVHGLHGRFVVFALGTEGPDTLPAVGGGHRVVGRRVRVPSPWHALRLCRRLWTCSSGKELSLSDWSQALVAVSSLEGPEAVPFEQLPIVCGWLGDAEWSPTKQMMVVPARIVNRNR